MAFSPLRSKALHHGRSLSLPSLKTQHHPTVSQFDETLSRIRSSEAATTSSLSSMSSTINGLEKLYCIIDGFLQSTRQSILQKKWFNQLLDGHISLLDACSTITDLCSRSKQDVQLLLSALRRKDVRGIHQYMAARRNSKKTIQKHLKDLKSFRNKCDELSLEEDSDSTALRYMLKEAESVTSLALEFLMSYMAGTTIVQPKQSGWSLVSKLIHSKKLSSVGQRIGETDLINEFNKVDAFLKMSQEDEELINHLKEMDTSIHILEEELECLFRQLIKTRVSLLNILNF